MEGLMDLWKTHGNLTFKKIKIQKNKKSRSVHGQYQTFALIQIQ